MLTPLAMYYVFVNAIKMHMHMFLTRIRHQVHSPLLLSVPPLSNFIPPFPFTSLFFPSHVAKWHPLRWGSGGLSAEICRSRP